MLALSLDSILSLSVPAVLSVIILILKNKQDSKKSNQKNETDLYKATLQEMNTQRQQVLDENHQLRDALREELENCRKLRLDTEKAFEELKIKVNSIEAELFSWRNGLKTPGGFILVRMPQEQQ